MSLKRIDVAPDEIVQWFVSYPETERKRVAVGPCPHDCAHRMTKVVAWGPDFAHYELNVCEDGCNGDCRAWLRVLQDGRELWNTIQWNLLEPLVPA